MPKGPKIPPPGNKKDEYTNFWTKAKWKANLLKGFLEVAGKNMRSNGAHIVANAMMKNKWVNTADMSHNHFGDEGATEIAQLIKVNMYLQTLNLSSNEISDIGGIAIASAFIPQPNPGQPGIWNRTMTVLNLSSNNFGDDTAIALAMSIKYCRDLSRLDVSYNRIGASGAAALFGALRHNCNITFIIHHNEVGDDGVMSICEALRLNGVTGAHGVLNLSQCDVGKAGADAVGGLININNFVQDVVLSNNTIGDLGCASIMAGLLGKHIIRAVYLQNNFLGDECGDDIRKVLEANVETLITIVLSNNEIGDKGGKAIAQGLLKNTTLQSLYLNHNRIGPETVETFCEVVRTSKTIKFLDLRRNGLKEDVRMTLSEAQKASPSSGFRMDFGAMESTDPGEEFLKKLAEYQTTMKQRAVPSGTGRRGGG
eukprot:PhM_4_TR14393/c0_g1_i1/m.10183